MRPALGARAGRARAGAGMGDDRKRAVVSPMRRIQGRDAAAHTTARLNDNGSTLPFPQFGDFIFQQAEDRSPLRFIRRRIEQLAVTGDILLTDESFQIR